MGDSVIRYETTGPLAILTMVHEPYNLLGPALLGPLLAALDRAAADGQRAVVLRSGLRHFCAGADLSLFGSRDSGGRPGSVRPAEILRRIETFPLPVVCSVHGTCLGGGLELALATDYVIAGRSARIGSVEAALGLHPLMGGIQRTAQRAGALRAKEMAMLARRYDPDTLAAWGLVNLVVEDDDLAEATMAVGLELAHGPTVAHTATKSLAYIAVNDGVAAADEAMTDIQKPVWASADLAAGLRSFRDNGPGMARFEGR